MARAPDKHAHTLGFKLLGNCAADPISRAESLVDSTSCFLGLGLANVLDTINSAEQIVNHTLESVSAADGLGAVLILLGEGALVLWARSSQAFLD